MKRSTSTHRPTRHQLSTGAMLCAWFSVAQCLYSQQTNRDVFLQWMNEIAQEQLQRREITVARVHTVADAERRKRFVREKILSLIGGLPEYSRPLNPRVTGRIQAERYSIEKVIFETL